MTEPSFSHNAGTLVGAHIDTLLSEIRAGAAERDRQQINPHQQIRDIAKLRLGAARLSPVLGGQGCTLRELMNFIIRLGSADSNVAHILRNHYVFVERYARRSESEAHLRWAALVAQGALFGQASSEINKSFAGRGGLQTQLVPEDDHYRLSGTKHYCTGTLYSDYINVRAVLVDGTPVSAFIPADREGVILHDDWDGMGQRLTGSGRTEFVDVKILPGEIVSDSVENHAMPYASTLAQLFLTAVVAGILNSVLVDAKAIIHARKRSFYHAPAQQPANDVLLQQAVGQIASADFTARAAVLAAADALDRTYEARDRGEPYEALALESALQGSQATVIVNELAIRNAALLFDVVGASSTARSVGLDRHWRNARTLATHNPTLYKQQALGAYELLGTPLPSQGYF